jgi:hypothetical protein
MSYAAFNHTRGDSPRYPCRICKKTMSSEQMAFLNKEQAREAEQKAAMWLHWGNLARERGDRDLAERHFGRSQKHHDEMNRLLGNGDGSD